MLMRRLLGGVVLVAGVGGLGWYAAQGPAAAMQTSIAEAAIEIATTAEHDVAAIVSGRDITVTGVAEDAAERDALLGAFDNVTGRRVVDTGGLDILPVASPYTLNLTKSGDGVNVSGNMPSAQAVAALGVDGLTVANGEPNDAWSDAAIVSMMALSPLKDGTLQIQDTDVTVSGVAATPTQLAAFNNAIASLPDGYTVTQDILVEDDGTPLRLTLRYDGETLSGSGKIPADVARTDVMIAGAETALDISEGAMPSTDGTWPTITQAVLTALGALSEGDAEIFEDQITLDGTGTPDGLATAEAALAAIPDGYVVNSNLLLSDDGQPFSLAVSTEADQVTAFGKVPADFDAAGTILEGYSADDLQVAFITDDSGAWPAIADAGLAALGNLENGTLSVGPDTIMLKGVARSPIERDAAQEALADYTAETDIALLDDGLPLTLTLTYAAETGAAVSGKLPADVSPVDVAEALNLEVTDSGATQAAFAADTDFLAPLEALRGFLPEISGLTYVATDEAISVDARIVPGVDPTQMAGALQAALGESAAIGVAARTDLPERGARRTNRFSGREEVFTAGYWLPVFDFFVTPESCTEQSNIVLQTDQVRFVTGSADLDVQSIRAINALASLARKCALEGGVFLQVAGHTDNTGSADANLALSEARANAVRDAILERGVAEAAITAVGYGDTNPVADNDTDTGRAANRRTEFIRNFE